RVIVQASRHEAFGLSLAEGMLCGAAPVVTRAGALPEVVGDTGIIVDDQEPAGLAAAIGEAAERWPSLGPRARTRVLRMFTVDQRDTGLESVLERVLAIEAEAR